jgi:hypothetical protein
MRNPLFGFGAVTAGLSALLCAPAAVSANAARFEAARLAVDGDVLTVVPADFDGDGRGDLLAVYKTGVVPREKRFFAVFWNGGRRFGAKPDLVLPADEPAAANGQICAFDVADVDGRPGAELLLITPRGVTSRSLRGRAAGAPVALVNESTFWLQPARGELPRVAIAHQLEDTGPPTLLLPGLHLLHVLRRTGEAYAPVGRLAVAMESRGRNYGRERRLRGVVAAQNTQYTFPALAVADTDGDGRRDIATSQEDRLDVYRQRPDGGFADLPTLRRDFATRSANELTETNSSSALTVTDIDGDSLGDVVARKQIARGITSAATTSFVYFGRKGGVFPDKPDQVIRNEGASGTEVELFDVTADGRTDLVVPSVNIGVFAIIRVLTTKTLKVNFQVFPFDARARRFSEQPAAERELRFKVSLSGEAGAQAADMRGDYNGDRRPDLAFGTDDNQLAIYPGTSAVGLFAEDAAEEIEVPAFGQLESIDLDRTGKSDMVLHYPRTRGHKREIVVLWNRGAW